MKHDLFLVQITGGLLLLFMSLVVQTRQPRANS